MYEVHITHNVRYGVHAQVYHAKFFQGEGRGSVAVTWKAPHTPWSVESQARFGLGVTAY